MTVAFVDSCVRVSISRQSHRHVPVAGENFSFRVGSAASSCGEMRPELGQKDSIVTHGRVSREEWYSLVDTYFDATSGREVNGL